MVWIKFYVKQKIVTVLLWHGSDSS